MEITVNQKLLRPDNCFLHHYITEMPITVVVRSKASTLLARCNTGIVVSNPTQGMGVCVRLLCVCVVLYVSDGLATG
jgi:uncharacterized membrane protein YoaT (DUF817 family)